tara:strand:- start:48 stop:485 length:438 start_codon:yes stop_codon:yes gene_type:complete
MQYKFKDSPTSWKVITLLWSIVALSGFTEPDLFVAFFVFILTAILPFTMLFKPNWTFTASLIWAVVTVIGIIILILDGSVADSPLNLSGLIVFVFIYYLKTNEAALMYINHGSTKDNSFSTKPVMNKQQDNNLSGFKVVRKIKDK